MKADELKVILTDHALWWAEKGGKQADLSGADLSGANLCKANLCWANLRMANLSEANLSKANLSGADLREANLSKANLSGADLSWADLSWADLCWANLRMANLSEANLSKADLCWANLSEAVGIIYAQCSFTAHGECGRQLSGVIIKGELRLFCGCFEGTLADLDAYIGAGEERYKPTRKLARDFIVAAIDAARKEQG